MRTPARLPVVSPSRSTDQIQGIDGHRMRFIGFPTVPGYNIPQDFLKQGGQDSMGTARFIRQELLINPRALLNLVYQP
jgi:hypothetical protein